MPQRATQSPDPRQVLIAIYAINDSMNQLLLEHLDPRAWRAKPSATDRYHKGRTIAAIFAHTHNARINWLKRSAPHLMRPAPLDPYRCTKRQVSAALKQSARECLRMLTEGLSDRLDRRVTKFVRDSWMPIWPADARMFGYMFAHEAHHRGQIILLAHQLGYRLPPAAWAGIWQWDKLWKARAPLHLERQTHSSAQAHLPGRTPAVPRIINAHVK